MQQSGLTRTARRLVEAGSLRQKSSSGLWDSGSQSKSGEFSDAFMEGMVFLQNYPVNAVGGIEAVLQVADDLTTKREAEVRATQAAGVGARIRGAVWGFSGQPGSAVVTPALSTTNEPAGRQETSAGITDPTAGPKTFTSRLANTVWRGITNKSAMDEPITPTSPSPPSPPRSPYPPSPQLLAQTFSPGPPSPLVLGSRGGTPEPTVIGTNLWNYAEKLRDSDAAAKLSKASTNLRVLALDAWHKRGVSESADDHPDPATEKSPSDVSHTRNYSAQSEGSYFSRTSSFSDTDPTYTPPPRPSHFRLPRDSTTFLDISRGSTTPVSPTLSAASDLSVGSTGSGRSISGGPKPLLLSTSNLVSPTNEGKKFWSHVTRDSVSSTSSLSPTDYKSKRRIDSLGWDSDTGRSRVVPIRRGTGNISPAAIVAKLNRSHPDSTSDRSDYPGKRSEEPKPGVEARAQPSIPEEDGVYPPSPMQSPPPETPSSLISPISEEVHVRDVEPQRGSLVLNYTSEDNAPIRSFLRRKTRSPIDPPPDEITSDSLVAGARIRHSQRVKARRQLPRLHTGGEESERTITASPSTLRPPEWPHGLGVEDAPTPRASDFQVAFPASPRSPRRPRKLSNDVETRPRKTSGESRESTWPRKVSGDRMRKVSGGSIRHNRESSSMEGDDEGYDDLLSAYESEGGYAM